MRKIYELIRTVKQTQLRTRADDHDAHVYMANMYLSLGHTERAEAEFKAAYDLRPTPQVRAQLDAIRKHNATRPSAGLRAYFSSAA